MKEPVELATQLQIKKLIPYSVMNELLTSPESQQAKAITLVRYLQKQIKSCPAKLFTIVEVFLQNAALKEPGKEMLQEIGKYCDFFTVATLSCYAFFTSVGKVCPERAAFVLGSEQPLSDSQVEIPGELIFSLSHIQFISFLSTGSESKRQSQSLTQPSSANSQAENATEWINSSAVLRALRRSNVIFTRGLDPENLVRVLYSQGLLTPEERDNATKQTSTTCQRLDEIFKAVERRVRVNPQCFKTLLLALSEEPAAEDVAKKMKGKYLFL